MEIATSKAPLPIVLDMLENLRPAPADGEAGTHKGRDVSAYVTQRRDISDRLGLDNELAELQESLEKPRDSETSQEKYSEHLNRALTAAVFANRLDVVQALRALGADPNASFDDRLSALGAASQNGNLKMFHLLMGS